MPLLTSLQAKWLLIMADAVLKNSVCFVSHLSLTFSLYWLSLVITNQPSLFTWKGWHRVTCSIFTARRGCRIESLRIHFKKSKFWNLQLLSYILLPLSLSLSQPHIHHTRTDFGGFWKKLSRIFDDDFFVFLTNKIFF